MIKSDDRRSEILDRLADYVLAEGLSASSLRPLAAAARISDRMLLYYFRDKAEVIAATLERIAGRFETLLLTRVSAAPEPFEAVRERLKALALDDAAWPYMQVWLDVASLAARGDPVCRAVGEQIGRGFVAWGAAQLDSALPQQREAEAATLFVMTEGLVLLKSLGLADVAAKAR